MAPRVARPQSYRAMKNPGIDIMRPPDSVSLHSGNGATPLKRAGSHWEGGGVSVQTEPRRNRDSWELPIAVEAPGAGLEHIHLRWRGAISETSRFLGDHWERSYGDLEWRAVVARLEGFEAAIASAAAL